MSTVTRTVRFKEHEIKNIEVFLTENPFFDFSQLTRVAINKFIESPELTIKGVSAKGLSAVSRTATKKRGLHERKK